MINEFCYELNQYLQDKYSYKKPPAYISNTNITANRVKFDLYLRFKPDREKETIVIARIGFREQKKGHGSMFLRFLSEVSGKYGIKYIEMESINPNSRAFGEKLGFEELPNLRMKILLENLISNLNKRDL